MHRRECSFLALALLVGVALVTPLSSYAATGPTMAIGTLAVLVPGSKPGNGIEVPDVKMELRDAPAGALARADGRAISGRMCAAVATMDPTRRAIPGGFQAIDGNNRRTPASSTTGHDDRRCNRTAATYPAPRWPPRN